jgi:hypothetical protein
MPAIRETRQKLATKERVYDGLQHFSCMDFHQG